MKKNEIKSDPVRNFLISFISKVKENSLQYLVGFLLLTAGFITLTISTSKTSPSDRSFCADSRIADMDIFKEHCASLGEYSTSAEELIFSVINIVNHKDSEKPLTLKQKITKMENINISDIKSSLIVALFYREYGEMLLDNSEPDKAIDAFLTSQEHYPNNDIYSAKLSYSLSLAYFEEKDLIKAIKYADKALSCDFENKDLSDKIKYLKGKLMYN